MLGELEQQSEVYVFNQIHSVIPVENAEVFSVNISLTFEMNIHCPNCHSCGSIFYPYSSNWIYLYDCLQWLKREKTHKVTLATLLAGSAFTGMWSREGNILQIFKPWVVRWVIKPAAISKTMLYFWMYYKKTAICLFCPACNISSFLLHEMMT